MAAARRALTSRPSRRRAPAHGRWWRAACHVTPALIAGYGRCMSETASAQYVAEFIDGPLEGDFEHRALVGGRTESRIGMVAAVDGLESLFWYDAVEEREVNGQMRVRFRFDASDSDPVESDEEND
jgi:hypothetical protein